MHPELIIRFLKTLPLDGLGPHAHWQGVHGTPAVFSLLVG
ncbi:MAG: hypothetical protein ACI89E_002285 [Planctomycetota bacterium]|jgi:hypothetical protein